MTMSFGSARRLRPAAAILTLVVALLAACSSDEKDNTNTPVGPVINTPAAITVVSGDVQSGDAGTKLPTTLAVKVSTSTGTAVAGTMVQFAVMTGAATLSASGVSTDASGVASTQVTLGMQAGNLQVKASVQGTSLSTTFTAIIRAAEPDSTLSATAYNPDWTDATHGKVSPNYSVVFPQASVNTIEISLTTAQWMSIRANMMTLYGFDFGGRPQLGGGDFPDDDPDYVAASLRYNGKQWKKVGFRLKGNSTLTTAWSQGNYKLPFRLKVNEFEGTYPAITGQRFYGFKELSFSPGRSDPSLIREKLSADLFRMAGVPAARTAFYRVFIDFGAGLRYCGVYTGVEVIDDTMVKDQFGEDKGNIYKPESRFQTFAADEFEKKNNKTALDYADVQATIAALNSPLRLSNAAQWRAGLEAVFSVDHFLKWLAVNNAIVNWDSYGTMAHNFYLYNHSSRKLLWIPWDHNEAMTGSPGVTATIGQPGNPPPGGGARGLSLTMNEVPQTWPLIRYVIDDPVYLALYKSHLKAFNENVLSKPEVTAMLDAYTALVTPYAVGTNGEQAGATYLTGAGSFSAALPALKTHVQSRVSLVRSYVP